MRILETERLNLRPFSPDDASFILELLNDPAWIQYIGDRGVHTLEDARNYIIKGPTDMQSRLGFSLYLTELKDGTSIGMCGLIKRDLLEDVDIGFAFLPQYRGKGYAYESAAAVMEYGRKVLGLERIVAITLLENQDSIKLLERIGLRFDRMMKYFDDEDVMLFVSDQLQK